jgi:hypothetical protein
VVLGFIDLALAVARLAYLVLDGGARRRIRREFEDGVVALEITLQFLVFLHKLVNRGGEGRVSRGRE